MLETVNLDLRLERDDYKRQLLECQLKLRELAHRLYRMIRQLFLRRFTV